MAAELNKSADYFPQKRPKVEKNSVIDLSKEWERQAGKYVQLGFHTELGLTEEAYCASLPKFEIQPETFVGRFDIPVLVETRVSPNRQAELVGFIYHLGGKRVVDWKQDPKTYKTPKAAYTVWMQDGKKNLNKSVREVRKAFAPDERGATLHDGIAFVIVNPPDEYKSHAIDLPGTSIDSGDAPVLGFGFTNGRLMVFCNYVGDASPYFGSASCGRIEA